MNTQNNKSNTNKQDINEVMKGNFEAYFQEVEKIMPEYLQKFTKLQENFVDAWKKTINSSIALQKELSEKADIETNIPQEYGNIIQSIFEEYIKSKNIQNQTILSAIEITSNNLKNQDKSFESVAAFNKKFLDFWVNFYSKK